MSIELDIYLAVNINLVSFSIYLGDLWQVKFLLCLFLTVAAAEAAIGSCYNSCLF